MKKFLFSFLLASASFIGFAQDPCASSFNVLKNGVGNACVSELSGSDAAYKRDGVVEIRFLTPLTGSTGPTITAIRPITSSIGQPVVVGSDLDMKFTFKRFSNTMKTTVEYCFYSKNNLNLNNASGSRYQVDIEFSATSSTTCDIEQESPTPSILPVSYGAFAAERKSSSSVFLKWNTLSEQNNKGFFVQRNTGSGWRDAGFVFSQTTNGYSSASLTYEFKDVNSEKATTQYRILQVDNDGQGKYSEIRLVRGGSEAKSGKVILYPNPSNTGKVSIAFEGNSERDITVHDMSGRIVKRLSSITSSNVVIEGLQSGFYTIQMVDRSTNEVTREKLVINNK